MEQQPKSVQMRNGRSRSRSHSVSRSRSRSRSRSADPLSEHERRDSRRQMAVVEITNGDEIASKMGLRRLQKLGVEPTVRQMQALPLGPLTDALLFKLVKQVGDKRGEEVALDEPLAIDVLAAEAGEVWVQLPSPLLMNLIIEPQGYGSDVHSPPEFPAPRIAGEKLMQNYLGKRSPKVTLGELSDVAEGVAHKGLMRLAEKIGNKHLEIGLDTRIDLAVLVAETGPETIPASLLCGLVKAVPESGRQSGFDMKILNTAQWDLRK